MIEAAYFEDNSQMMTIATPNGTQSGMMQSVQSQQNNIDDNNPNTMNSSVTTSSHEHNISYVDPIDEALHTSYQWSMPGVSIDHVCFFCLYQYIFFCVLVYLFFLTFCTGPV